MVIVSPLRENQFLRDDYIRDTNGIIYLVILNDHPPNSVVVIPKYIPTPGGKWRGSYSRLFQEYTSTEFHNVVKMDIFRKYQFYSKNFNKKLLAIPHNLIKEHYIPEKRLEEIVSSPRRDLTSLEKKAADTVDLIIEMGVEQTSIGITGSLLYNLHMPFSNLSMIMYGLEATEIYLDKIDEIVNTHTSLRFKSQFLKLDDKKIDLSPRIKTFLWMEDVSVTIHANQFPDFQFRYGSEFVQTLGICEVTAEISNVSKGFIQKSYIIRPVEIITWPNIKNAAPENLELRIFSGRSEDIIFKEEEAIQVSGVLQQVGSLDRRQNKSIFRLSVGLEESPGYACPISLLSEKT
ncbi:MAG: hypothetical protein ACXAB4_01795 [Candidatus Hodarchaeales archaeon]